MPKLLLKIQNFIMRFIPRHKFEEMGFSKENFISIANSMTKINFTELLNKISCATLVINGEKDKVNFKAANEMARKLRNAELIILKDAGHEIIIQQPKALAIELNKFLKRVD